MTFYRYIAIALMSFFAVVADAQAMAINPSPLGSLDSPLGVGAYGKYSISGTAGSYIIDTLNGYISSGTKITITYSYGDVDPFFMSIDGTGANSGGQTTASIGAINYPGSGLTVLPLVTTSTAPGLPIFATANLTIDTGKAVIADLSSSVISFSSLFKAFVLSDSGFVNVWYEVSPVPLPPALVLFLAGLASFAGLRFYRKNRV